MAIDVTNLVSNGSVANGVFDDLMDAVEARLETQYTKNRITGTDYANVYLGSMQTAVSQAVIYLLGEQKSNAESLLIQNKAYTEEAQIRNKVGVGVLEDYDNASGNTDGVVVFTPKTAEDPASGEGVLGKQQVLYNKQTDGYDRDAEQKLLKVAIDFQTILISSGILVSAPKFFNEDDIDKLAIDAASNIDVTFA